MVTIILGLDQWQNSSMLMELVRDPTNAYDRHAVKVIMLLTENISREILND